MEDELYYEAIDTLKAIISIPSFSKEEDEVATYLQQRWKNDGMKVNRNGNNLWICSPHFSPIKPTILLNSHIDTVRPVDTWTKDPFDPVEIDGRLYGLGSNDAGASLVALYAAFRILTSSPQPYNLIYIASAEEEISGPNGIESILSLIPQCAFAIVGEPTEMNPATAEKGLLVVDCTASGTAGHAARNEGLNAITIAIKDIEWINSYTFPQESPLLGPVKMTVTIIQAGTQHNIIPDKCTFTIDIRTNECYSHQQIIHLLKNNLQSTPSPRSLRLKSSSISHTHPVIQRATLLGRTPFGSPTLSDQALIPAPSLKIGPGLSQRSHTADEYIMTDEIREAIPLYTKLLHNLSI